MSHAADVIVDLLRRGHAVQFRVHGDSMHPVIRAEDLVHVEPRTDMHVGDVVLVLAERGLTAHRITAIAGTRIVTRGDNAPAADPVVDASAVLGVITHVIRGDQHLGVRRRLVAAFTQRAKNVLNRLRRRQ